MQLDLHSINRSESLREDIDINEQAARARLANSPLHLLRSKQQTLAAQRRSSISMYHADGDLMDGAD